MSDEPKIVGLKNPHREDLDAGLEMLSGIPGKEIKKLVASIHQLRREMEAQGDHQKDINAILGACVGFVLLKRL